MKFEEFKEKLRSERGKALFELFEREDVIDANLIYNLVMQVRIISRFLKELEEDEE